MEKVIHIVKDECIGLDVLVTEEELASFRKAAARAAKTGQKITFDDWALNELRKAFIEYEQENKMSSTWYTRH